METFLVLNGHEIEAATDAQEHLMLDLTTGRLDHRRLTDWLRRHLKPLGSFCPPNAQAERPASSPAAPARCSTAGQIQRRPRSSSTVNPISRAIFRRSVGEMSRLP
jgi:hypothetical protein